MNINLDEIRAYCDSSKGQKILVDDMVIQRGALAELPRIMSERYGNYHNVVMICDDNTYRVAGAQVEELLPNLRTVKLNPEGLHADEHGVAAAQEQLSKLGAVGTADSGNSDVQGAGTAAAVANVSRENEDAPEAPEADAGVAAPEAPEADAGVAAPEAPEADAAAPDFLIACGSGTIHDITRYHAHARGIDFLSIPTAASVDGFVSTMAAMTWHGMKQTFTATSPVFVLADTDIFSQAPARLTASGVADLLGKYTALCDWRIGHAITGEYISWPIVNWEYDFLSDLIENLDGIAQGTTEAFESLMVGLLLSGLAMQIITYSRPASGCEHHCSHLWEEAAINAPIDYYHGEKVGVGLCICVDTYKRALAKLKEGNYRLAESVSVETDLIRQHFTAPKLCEEILKENKINVMGDLTAEQIRTAEPAIIEILEDLPSAERVAGWLKQVGAPTAMEEIGLDPKLRTLTLRLSPYVRYRLSFMRLLKFYDFYEEVIEN